MIYTDMTKKAIKLMYEKHKNQIDKSGMPYVLHPLHVAESMKDEKTTVVALLHDIVEDTDITLTDLIKMQFPKEVVDAIGIMTHTSELSYYEYIERISSNPISTEVKLADLKHNMDLSRLNQITKEDLERLKKYKKSFDYLFAINEQYKKERENKEMITNEEEKIESGFLGFAIGDALGVPVEFLSRSTLKNNPVTDMVGYGSHNVPEGTWSDDTSMMLATMDSIIEKGTIDYKEIMYKFSEWVNNAKYTATAKLFDIGIATSNAIINYQYGLPSIECGMRGLNENGNGSLMRILPVIFYSYSNNLSEEEEVELINNCSSLTHAHEISKLGCKIYSDYVKMLLKNTSKEQALINLSKKDYKRYYSEESINYYKRILSGKISNLNEEQIKSSGFIVDTLEASIWCTITENNYESAVEKAVNLGDDTDTIGAITGAINGIIYGKESIPEKWKSKLRKKDYLESLSIKFYSTLKNKNIAKENKILK